MSRCVENLLMVMVRGLGRGAELEPWSFIVSIVVPFSKVNLLIGFVSLQKARLQCANCCALAKNMRPNCSSVERGTWLSFQGTVGPPCLS